MPFPLVNGEGAVGVLVREPGVPGSFAEGGEETANRVVGACVLVGMGDGVEVPDMCEQTVSERDGRRE